MTAITGASDRLYAIGYKPVNAAASTPFKYLRGELDREGALNPEFLFTWAEVTRLGSALARLSNVGSLSIRSKPLPKKAVTP